MLPLLLPLLLTTPLGRRSRCPQVKVQKSILLMDHQTQLLKEIRPYIGIITKSLIGGTKFLRPSRERREVLLCYPRFFSIFTGEIALDCNAICCPNRYPPMRGHGSIGCCPEMLRSGSSEGKRWLEPLTIITRWGFCFLYQLFSWFSPCVCAPHRT